MDKINILFVCPTGIYGGGEVYLKSIVNGVLDSRKFGEIHLISPGNLLEKEINEGVILHDGYDTKLKMNLIRLILKINRVIKSFNISHVYINGFNEFGWCAPFIGSKVKICVGHNNFDTFERSIFAGNFVDFFKLILKRPLQHLFFRLAFLNLDKFICINKMVYGNLSKRLKDKSKLVQIYNGVDPISISDVADSRKDKVFCFGRIGRLESIKGNYYLVDSFLLLTEEYTDCNLIFAGSGPEIEGLKEYVRFLGIENKVQFWGFTKKEEFYAQVDVVISSSSYEASPLVILEAMSCKRPVISTKVGGVPEIINHNTSGLLVNYGDSEGMKAAMAKLFNNSILAKKLADNAYVDYQNYFKSKIMTEKTLSVIENA